MTYSIPPVQQAVQLTGPDELVLNKEKPVVPPGPHQVLCRVEAVGLCFSDLKLLKQFSAHPRKKVIASGIDGDILKNISSYVPGELPTVPGHEAVVRVVAVGDGVTDIAPGDRYLVQTDYRWLPTDGSNASFGYDFEGGLQEYVLMDQRIITSPEGESMLIPADEDVSASAIALVEPWACVENSYASCERTALKSGGNALVISDADIDAAVLNNLFSKYGSPSSITWISGKSAPQFDNIPVKQASSLDDLPDASYDDIVYFGSSPEVVEAVFPKVAVHGLLNVVLCGGRFGRPVVSAIGRVHYGGIRIIGTTGYDPSESMASIPTSGEIREGDRINIIGAGGPMGMMHVIRDICQGVDDVSVYAGDLNEDRLSVLAKIAAPLAENRKVAFTAYNPSKDKIDGDFNYLALMVPVPALVAQAIKDAAKYGIINIFAGIPAQVTAGIDLDSYIEKSLYFIGTSGSVLNDMKVVLAKVQTTRQLDTNLSVAAISGLDGAIEGIRAVENQLLPGKIIVYPSCKGMGLIPLEQIKDKMPDVAEYLSNGLWTLDAEKKLIELYGSN
ncbi:MAG: alcohol dehydrogenase catalytic domain-containing protein [Armatimonadota bacterium]